MGKGWLRPGLVLVGLAIAACQSAVPAPVTVSGGVSAVVTERATGLTLSVGVNTRSAYRLLQQGYTEADVSHLRVVLTELSGAGSSPPPQILDPVTKATGSAEYSFNLNNLRFGTTYSLLIEAKTFSDGTAVTIGQTTDTFTTGTDAAQTLYRSYTIALGDREFTGQAPVGIGFTPGVGIATPAAPEAIKTPYAQGWNVTTLAGSDQGFADGNASGAGARFDQPHGVAVDGAGRVYVADTMNHCIRRINTNGSVVVLAGAPTVSGDADGQGNVARFNQPHGVVVDAIGNLYVADKMNQRIRKITPLGLVTTLAGSTGGYADGTGATARFSYPVGLCLEPGGSLYVADQANQRIRRVTSTGVVSTIAGGSTSGYVDGIGAAAQFYNPVCVAVDRDGNVLVGDSYNHCIRKITNPTASPVVSTYAGAGTVYGTAEGEKTTQARFQYPDSLALDPFGTLYVLDYTRVRKISPSGIVSPVAGQGSSGFSDGVGNAAAFSSPFSLALASSGHLYVGDKGNHRIRRIQ